MMAFAAGVLPPVEIGPSDLGLGAGEYGERRPLSLLGAQFGVSAGTAAGWHTDMRKALDTRFLARRSRTYQKRLKAFRLAKENAALFSAYGGTKQTLPDLTYDYGALARTYPMPTKITSQSYVDLRVSHLMDRMPHIVPQPPFRRKP